MQHHSTSKINRCSLWLIGLYLFSAVPPVRSETSKVCSRSLARFKSFIDDDRVRLAAGGVFLGWATVFFFFPGYNGASVENHSLDRAFDEVQTDKNLNEFLKPGMVFRELNFLGKKGVLDYDSFARDRNLYSKFLSGEVTGEDWEAHLAQTALESFSRDLPSHAEYALISEDHFREILPDHPSLSYNSYKNIVVDSYTLLASE